MGSRKARNPLRWYYFAYGSNMSLKQMAERCPSSVFMGKGRIDGYRWQINERGVANIVRSGRDFVEGLVYQIDLEDKRQLDRNEGVARGLYDREHLYTQLTPLPRHRGIKTFHVAKELETDSHANPEDTERRPPASMSRRDNVRDGASGKLKSSWTPTHTRQDDVEMIEALVYISHDFKDDGHIRSEYIGRMEKAIVDGQKMGLSRLFLAYIDRLVHRDVLQVVPDDTGRREYCSREGANTVSTSREPHETIRNTQFGEREDEVTWRSQPIDPTYTQPISVRPRDQGLHPPDGDSTYWEHRDTDENSHRNRYDTARRPETRERRRYRSRSGSRQTPNRHERRDGGSSAGRFVTRVYEVVSDGMPVVERRTRSRSTPY